VERISDVPIKLSDEMDHVKYLPLGQGYYETNGCMVVASSEGNDILLWASPQIIGGGQWVVPHAIAHATQLIVVPSEQRGKGMYNNNFARVGWHPTQYLKPEELEIVKKSDKVVWKVGERQYIHRPPVWEIKGSHAGVELDLVFRQAAPPIWAFGPFEKLAEQSSGGYDCFVSVNGTIKAASRTYSIKDGLALKEHCVLGGQAWDVIGQNAPPNHFYWTQMKTQDIQVYFFRQTARGINHGRIGVEGKEINYMPGMGAGSISFNTLDHWHDPRSGLYLPCRWHLVMSSAQGTVDLEIAAHARLYYHYNAQKGVLLMMWFLSTANGVFYFPDGRSLPIKDALVCTEWGRTILVAEETLAGQVT
jgi:hypothetical protein